MGACAARLTPSPSVSGTCAQMCLPVSVLSVGVLHSGTPSELLANFLISFCSGTVLFCYALGLASSCSPRSFGGGPAGWAAFLALLAAQLLWAPAAAAVECYAGARAMHAYLRHSSV